MDFLLVCSYFSIVIFPLRYPGFLLGASFQYVNDTTHGYVLMLWGLATSIFVVFRSVIIY